MQEQQALNGLVSPDEESASDILGKFSTSPGSSEEVLWDIFVRHFLFFQPCSCRVSLWTSGPLCSVRCGLLPAAAVTYQKEVRWAVRREGRREIKIFFICI